MSNNYKELRRTLPPPTDFTSTILNADGKLLLTGIYFNGIVSEIISSLEKYKKTYNRYDFLYLENDGNEGYNLVGYVRKLAVGDIISINTRVPCTNLTAGETGIIVKCRPDNTYKVEFVKDNKTVFYTIKAVQLSKEVSHD